MLCAAPLSVAAGGRRRRIRCSRSLTVQVDGAEPQTENARSSRAPGAAPASAKQASSCPLLFLGLLFGRSDGLIDLALRSVDRIPYAGRCFLILERIELVELFAG